MSGNWSLGESVVVRPFLTADEFLQGVKFRLSPDRPFEARDTFETSEVNLATIAPEFQLVVADGLPKKLKEHLSLVIRLHDVHLHRSVIHLEAPLTDIPPTFAIPPSDTKRYAWKSGVRAVVAIMQRKDRKRVPEEPFLRGHWIARRVITVGRDPKGRAFPIERWEPKEFQKRGLPVETVYWLDFVSTDLNRTYKDPADAFKLGIHGDVYDALAASEQSLGTKAFYAMLLTEVYTDLLVVGLSDLGQADLQRGGVLDALVKRLERAVGLSLSKLRAMSKEEDGRARIRAHVQSMMQAREPIARLRRGGAS